MFSGTEQLSLTLQGKDPTLQDASMAADCAGRYLRSDDSFDLFYKEIVQDLTSPPTLPRYRQPPRRLGEEGAPGHSFRTVESYFRKQYFEVIDLLVNELQTRFMQKRGLPVACTVEKVLISSANRASTANEDLPPEIKFYGQDT